MKKIYIYGASGHGKVVADIARACGYDEVRFIDDGNNVHPCFDEIMHDPHTPIALGIGDNRIREVLFKKIKAKNLTVATLIHPTATLSPSASIGEGTVVMPHSVINADTVVGKACIVNTSVVIEHDNCIGDFAHISPAAALAGTVTVGHHTHIGIGSCIIQGITVGEGCIIGAGSVVVNNIDNGYLCYGNPCKPIKEIK